MGFNSGFKGLMCVCVLHDIIPSVIYVSSKLLGEYIKLRLWTNALYMPKTGMLLGMHTGLKNSLRGVHETHHHTISRQ